MKQKINLRLAGIALFAIITVTVAVTSIYYMLFQRQVRDDLKTSAELLKETEMFQTAHKDAVLGEPIVLPAKFDPQQMRVTWIDETGKVLYDNESDAKILPNHMDRPEIRAAFLSGEGESIRRSSTLDMDSYYCALLLEDGTVLRVGIQARAITGLFLSILPMITLLAGLLLLICVLISHALTRQLLKPIEEMAENLDKGNEKVVYSELEPFAHKIRSQHDNILSAAKSRQDFTASVSHELKTPLTAISGYAELIENHMVSGEDETHIAEQIRQNADRLLTLINDIIRLSELDHSELPRKFEQVDLFAVAKECCAELQVNAEKRGIRLVCAGISAGINAEKDLIHEMIDNLVLNAIRYNKDKGSVYVRVTIDKGHPILEVRDTGIGIPEDQQERVFERFYRVDKSRSRQSGGTGLGLSIVKHIAQIHSADISLKSSLGFGTTITVRF